MDELCSVCKTLNLTFRFPPKEIPFEEWLENWERERPHYNWRTQDRSIEAKIKRHMEELTRLSEDSWSDSNEDDDRLNSSVSSPDVDGEAADGSAGSVLGSGESSSDGSVAQSESESHEDSDEAEVEFDAGDDDDGGDDDGDDDLNSTDDAKDRYLEAQEHVNSHEDSNPEAYLEAHEFLDADDDSDGIEQEGSEKKAQQGKDDDADHKARLENIREEREKSIQRKLETVLNFLGLDINQYRAENVYSKEDGHWRRTRVLRKKEVEEPESGYESDNQSTIENLLEWGHDYVLGNDKEFESGIRDESSTHWAKISLEYRWKLETYAVRRCHKDAQKPVKLGTVSEVASRLPCRFCATLLDFLKPTMKNGKYHRDEFNPGLLPTDLEDKIVSLEFNGEFSEHNEFVLDVDSGGAVGSIRRADSVIKGMTSFVQDQMPWMDPKFEIGAYQQLNSQAIRRYLEECEHTHPTCRTIQQATIAIPEYPTLFIDVEQGCLVKGTLDYRYLALSYVWGRKPMLETTQENLTDLQRKDALQAEGLVLSRVVKDSMKLTQLLGERYLWIDVLCIVQDDSVNKMRHISNMDAIYKQALLTIVAHSGTSSDSPLPGVEAGTRFPIVTSRKVCGTHLVCQPKYYGGFSGESTYSTRGWTYQEEVLSSRRLYLYHSHAAFQCCTTRYRDVLDAREDVHLDWFRNPLSKLQHQFGSREGPEGLPFDAEAYKSYTGAVREFSHRKLTFPGDTVNAFSGVMRVMEKLFGTRFCSGLPEGFIDAALLWSSRPKGKYYAYENGPETHLKMYLRKPDFPSWCWSGHGGHLDSDGFGIFMTQGDPKSIRSEIPGFAILGPDGLRRRLFRTACPLVEMPGGDSDITQDLESIPTSAAGKRSILCFPTRVVSDDFLPIDGYPSRLATGRIFTATEKRCGLLFPDDSECWREKPLGRRKWIILSRGNVSGPEEDVAEKTSSYNEHFDPKVFQFHCKWSFYNIMLVEERGDVVERIALGQIHIDAWPYDKETKEMVFLG